MRENDATLGNDFGYNRPRGIDDRRRGDELLSQERGIDCLQCYCVRDAIPRIRRYAKTIYRLISKAIPAMLKYIHGYIQACAHFRLVYPFRFIG